MPIKFLTINLQLKWSKYIFPHIQTINTSNRLRAGVFPLSDECQPSLSLTDIDGYLGLFLQSAVHLRPEIDSISAWMAARVAVGQGNLAGWHPVVSLSELLSYLSSHFQGLPQTNKYVPTQKPLSYLLRDTNWSSAEIKQSLDICLV